MINRSKHLPVYTMLVGLMLLSVGFNFFLYGRILILQDFIKETNYWVSVQELDMFEKELLRLENTKYNIVSPNTMKGE
jgi:hypothetical protein